MSAASSLAHAPVAQPAASVASPAEPVASARAGNPVESPADLLEYLPDPMTLSRAVRDDGGRAVDMRVEYMNPAARARQPRPDAAIGRLCSKLWPQMRENGSFAACMRVLDTGRTEGGELEWTEGGEFRPAGYEFRAARVGTDLLLWVMRDITERIAQARALAESEARFRAAFEAAAVGMALVAPDGAITMVNGALAELAGEGPDALCGRRFDELVPPEPGASGLASSIAGAEGEVAHRECEIVRTDGERLPAWLSTALVRDLDGRPLHVIAHLKDASVQHRVRAALAHAATHDPLTGLPNRVLLQDRLERALRRRERTGRTCAVLCLDLDHFKSVNDSLGHAVGDELLREVGRRVRSVLRATDTVARLGGDEFVVLCEDLDPACSTRTALELGRQVGAALEGPVQIEGHALALGATVGVAVAHGASATDLLRDADAALYEAKRQGRGGCMVFDERLGSLTRGRSRTEAGLRQAVARNEFEPYFHPLVDLDTASLIGVEALARWRSDRRVLEPGAFIEVAQETGLIVPISEAIARAASRTVAEWRQRLKGTVGSELRVSLNVAPCHVTLPGFAQRIEDILAGARLPPDALILEITEEGLMLGEAPVTRPLERLRAQGVLIALDDFGSGFSSLGRLRHLPVDIIKVDRAFLRGESTDQDAALLRAFVDLSHAFGLTALIEGVEDSATLTAAHRAGYALAQGHHFSVPLPADAFWQRHLAART